MKPNFTVYPTLRASATRAVGEGSQAPPADSGGRATSAGPVAPEPTEWTDKLELREWSSRKPDFDPQLHAEGPPPQGRRRWAAELGSHPLRRSGAWRSSRS